MLPKRILSCAFPFSMLAAFALLARCSDNPVSNRLDQDFPVSDLVWDIVNLPVSTNLISVTGESIDDVFVLAGDGTLMHNDGSGWSVKLEGSDEFSLSAAWGSSATCVYTVGKNETSGTGMILKYSPGAASWYYNGCGTGHYQRGVWGKDAGEVFALADFGYIQRCTNGSAFMVIDRIEGVERLFDIWLCSPDNMVVVGGEGIYHKRKATGWGRVETGPAKYFKGVWGSGSDDIFAVGVEGAIMHFNGFLWEKMQSGTGETLNDVWGFSGRSVFAVGNCGAVLYYDGRSWEKIATGYVGNLISIWGCPGPEVYAAGPSALLRGRMEE